MLSMNILLCCENYFPSIGGVQEVIRQIAERLVTKGHVVTVATKGHLLRQAYARINGVEVFSFDIRGNLVQGMHGDVYGYQNFVINGNFDAVMVKAAQQWSFDALIPILEKIRCRKIFIPCGFSGFYEKKYLKYYREMYLCVAKFDALIFYSYDYRDVNYAKVHDLKNIHIIPNGADEREFNDLDDHDFRSRFAIDNNQLLLLTVGSLNGHKGHWEVARAFELMELERPATLILNGTGISNSLVGLVKRKFREIISGRISLDKLISRINRSHLGKRVLLVDLPRKDLVDAFKASDLFVFSSYVEYSPLVLFEAIAAGTPFVSVPVGNSREIAQWTNAGLISESTPNGKGLLKPNPLILARDIESIVRQPDRMLQFGGSGRKAFIEGGFSWADIVNRYELILSGRSDF